jgi:hypothetical protein
MEKRQEWDLNLQPSDQVSTALPIELRSLAEIFILSQILEKNSTWEEGVGSREGLVLSL